VLSLRASLKPFILLTAGFLLLIGCSATEQTGFTEDVVDGVTIRTYLSSDPPELNPCRVEEPVFYGAGQGADTFLLAAASYAGTLPDGGVVIHDWKETRLHVFEASGEHRLAFGSRGEGPGEFLRASTILVSGDSLLIADFRMQRFLIFRSDGSFLYQHRFADPMPTVNSRLALLSGGRYAVRSFRAIPTGSTSESLHYRDEFQVLIFDTGFGSPQEVFQRTGTRSVTKAADLPLPRPFNPHNMLVGGLGSYAPFAWMEDDGYRIDFLDLRDGSRWATILPVTPSAVTHEARESFIQTHIEWGYPESDLRRFRLPDHTSPVQKLIWDESGRLWAMDWSAFLPRSDEDPYWFNVFDKDGTWLFRQGVPVEPDYISREGLFVNARYDAPGDPMVTFYRLVSDGSETERQY